MSFLNVEIIEEELAFLGTDTASITYHFDRPPFVTATSSVENVNVYVESITNAGCTIRTSAPISGKVHVHIIGNK